MDKEKLIESLCDRYSYIIKLLRIIGVDENDVEDLTADIFVAAFKNINSLRDEERLLPWLKAIANNRARKYFGRRKKHKEISNMMKMEAGEIDIYDIVADEITVEKILQEAEESAMVESLLNSLSDSGKMVVRMRFWGNYKFNEIAEVMNLNINTVKSVYRRSLKKLEINYRLFAGKEGGHG